MVDFLNKQSKINNSRLTQKVKNEYDIRKSLKINYKIWSRLNFTIWFLLICALGIAYFANPELNYLVYILIGFIFFSCTILTGAYIFQETYKLHKRIDCIIKFIEMLTYPPENPVRVMESDTPPSTDVKTENDTGAEQYMKDTDAKPDKEK